MLMFKRKDRKRPQHYRTINFFNVALILTTKIITNKLVLKTQRH